MTAEEVKIVKKAIDHYGADMQETVAMEELAELIKEISKIKRNESGISELSEEIADALIMIYQLIIIFGNIDRVREQMSVKLERLEKRIEAAKDD